MPWVTTLDDVKVVAEGDPLGAGRLVCEVKGKTVSFHSSHILPGSTVKAVGDVGTLVIPQWVAVVLGLA